MEPPRPPPLVLLDANALLLPFREGFPLERELLRWAPRSRWAVPESAWHELGRLAASGHPAARAARAWAVRLPREAAPGAGDAALLARAVATGAWVVTGDRILLGRLHERGVAVLRPSGGSRLVLRPGAALGSAAPAAAVISAARVQRPGRRR